MSLDVGQWAALAGDLAGAPARIHATAAPAVHAALAVTEAAAKSNAAVLTGEMRGSIHTEPDGDGLGGTVVADSPHAIYNEYGTSKMAAQPFMAPAADAGAPTLEEGLAVAGEMATL